MLRLLKYLYRACIDNVNVFDFLVDETKRFDILFVNISGFMNSEQHKVYGIYFLIDINCDSDGEHTSNY